MTHPAVALLVAQMRVLLGRLVAVVLATVHQQALRLLQLMSLLFSEPALLAWLAMSPASPARRRHRHRL
jgi:hypothetical protein